MNFVELKMHILDALGAMIRLAVGISAEEVGIARFGKPEEIADLMAYLVSPAARWMTGSCVRMDGGEIKGI